MADEIKSLTTEEELHEELVEEEEVVEEESKEEEEEPEEEEEESTEEEETETEEETEEKTEKEDELVFESVPKRQEILKKYPEIFKEFPGLQKAIYREQQFAEVFSTVDDAKQARDRLSGFERLESSIFSGDLSLTLNQLKQNDPNAFNKIADNYLQQLAKVDNQAYLSNISRIVKQALATAHARGKETKDDQLQIAAELLHKFIYNTPEITIDRPQEERISPEQQQFRDEQINFRKQLLLNATKEIGNRTSNIIRSMIDKSIDPKEQMSPYIRNKAIDDAMNLINDSLGTDARFRSVLDKQWAEAIRDNYSERAKLRIRNALISRAKSELSSVINKVRSEALKGTIRKSSSKSDEPLPRQKSSGSSGKKDVPPKGIKTIDYLMQD